MYNKTDTDMNRPRRHERFPLGRLLATRGAVNTLTGEQMMEMLVRHAGCDWGDVDDEDWRANNHALDVGTRLFSAYQVDDDTRVWVITEAGRHATTVLLPREY